MDTVEISNQFLDFYSERGYTSIPGSSLLDPSVPMSFVMSAGLVQVETSSKAYDGKKGQRYALIQNCFRYFDLENIGISNTHLSLFRMAGTFTFGKVNRSRMVQQIWMLLTENYLLPTKRLWVTYFSGDKISDHQFEADSETYEAWRQIGLPPERLVGLGAADNFWKQGTSVVGERDAPKCGPNTEVFFDRGAHFSCGPECRPGCRCGRFVELMNTLLITQHIDDRAGIVSPLDEPFTETVLGIERMAMLLQDVISIYQIDGIAPLLETVSAFGPEASLPEDKSLEQMCILVDHLRAMLFLAADGAPAPGRGGRARLMRKLARGMLTAQIVLGIASSSLYPELVDKILTLQPRQAAHLGEAKARLLEMIEVERERFERTLQSGQRRLRRILERSDENLLDGETVVALEKQHGVPLPLLKIMLRNQRASYNEQDYKRAYANWRLKVVQSSA
jgi:alanyl-tRNA synthetase